MHGEDHGGGYEWESLGGSCVRKDWTASWTAVIRRGRDIAGTEVNFLSLASAGPLNSHSFDHKNLVESIDLAEQLASTESKAENIWAL